MRKPKGFTFIELMIVVAIVAILAAIAIPQYQDYVSRTRASSAMSELGGYRYAISECVALQSSVTGCSAGNMGIPPLAAFVPTRNLTAIVSVVNGQIIATSGATESSGGTRLGIVNTPEAMIANKAILTWSNTGTICNSVRGLKRGQGDCP